MANSNPLPPNEAQQMTKKLRTYSLDIPQERDYIIEQCCGHNRIAQEMIYRRYFSTMEKMVLRHTQDEDQIIDIINDGFMRVFKKIDLYEGKGSFEGWIRRIVYHSISNYFRKYSKDLKFLIYEESYRKEPKTAAQHQLYYQDLLSLVKSLPEKHMRIFHLFAIEGFDHEDISQQLNINKNTCRWYLSEARKLLQTAYAKQYTKNYNEAG